MTTVFIVSEYSMFGHGLNSLLSEVEELNVVGQEKDLEQATIRIKSLQPDVVILFGNGSEKINTSIINLLKSKSDMQVIGVSVEDNTCYTYRAEQWKTRNVSDLVRVIKRDPSIRAEYQFTHSG